jgi:hypothetical protein
VIGDPPLRCHFCGDPATVEYVPIDEHDLEYLALCLSCAEALLEALTPPDVSGIATVLDSHETGNGPSTGPG